MNIKAYINVLTTYNQTYQMYYQTTISKILVTLSLFVFSLTACTSPGKTEPVATVDSVATNIKAYTHVWEEIMNHRKLETFNDSNFSRNVVLRASPTDVVGLDDFKAYYENFLTGFSDIQFTIKDIFGQGNKLVKYWNFKGKHTGSFFGIHATGNSVNIDGTTLVLMENGKIAEERDFFDNLEFMTQLGQMPPAVK